MEPKYNKENQRQYNNKTLDAAIPQDFAPNVDAFTEDVSPAVPQNEIGGRTKEQQDLCLKSIDLALDIVKLTADYTTESVFKCAAMVLKYINVKKS